MSESNIIPQMRSSDYFEPDTVRITVWTSQHHGKVWQHTHNFFEFVYIDSGFSLHSYNGKTSVLTGGDLFAIYPGEVHSYSRAYHTDLYNCLFYLEDLGSLSDEVLRLPNIDWERKNKDTLPIIRVGLAERRELVGLLERMRWERRNKAPGWELNLKSMLINFLVTYSRLVSESKVMQESGQTSEPVIPGIRPADELSSKPGELCPDERGYSGYIYSVLRFVEENYEKDISGRDIAEAAGLSGDYLTKQFKTVMSMTPAEYVRKFRIAKSMDLLRTTDMSIADIASAVGFGNISLYSRVFKQMIGVSPAAFRKE